MLFAFFVRLFGATFQFYVKLLLLLWSGLLFFHRFVPIIFMNYRQLFCLFDRIFKRFIYHIIMAVPIKLIQIIVFPASFTISWVSVSLWYSITFTVIVSRSSIVTRLVPFTVVTFTLPVLRPITLSRVVIIIVRRITTTFWGRSLFWWSRSWIVPPKSVTILSIFTDCIVVPVIWLLLWRHASTFFTSHHSNLLIAQVMSGS